MRYLFTLLFYCYILSSFGQLNTDSLDQLINSNIEQQEKGNIAVQLSKYYMGKDLDKVQQYASQAEKFLVHDDSMRVEALDQLARYYFFKSNLDSAIYFFNNAQETAQKIPNEYLSASLGNSIASVYIRQSKYEQALQSLVSSAQYFETAGDSINASKFYSNMSAAHAALRNYKQAIKYSNQALDIFRKNKLDQYTLITLPNLATQHLQLGDTSQAIEIFLEAEEMALLKDNKRSLALTYNNLGDLYLTKREFNKATNYLEKSIAAKQELNLLKGIDNTFHNLGYVMAQQGDHRRAIDLYNQALEYADISNRVVIYTKLKDSYKSLGETNRALEFADLSIALKDSVEQVANTKNFAEISAKYETTKKENEILQLESQNQKLEITKNRNRTMLIGAIGLFVGLSLLSFLSFKNQKRKQLIAQQQYELEQKRLVEEMQRQELESIDRIIQGQDEERNRISADLHDSLGSKMATLKLFVDELDEQGSGSANGLEQVREIADIAYQEVRNMSHQLNSGVLVKKGLIPAIRSMADLIAHAKNIQINVIDLDSPSRLGNIKEIQIFRIIQELLTNIVKHAEASEATIQIAGHEDMVSITVEDNGKGFSNKDPGLGLANIANRVSELSGNHEIDSMPGEGTSVIINVPI